MAFPSSPSNGDVYIKDGVRYVYASASNSWTIQIDPNKVAGNIKSGVSIDNVAGTLTHIPDANLIAENIKSGIVILGVTGTYADNLSAELNVLPDGSSNPYVYYHKIGKVYIFKYAQNGSNPGSIFSDAATRAQIASALGITINSYGEYTPTTNIGAYQFISTYWTLGYSTGTPQLIYIEAV